MSGHSKWNNIKRKKEKTDAARAKIFTKIGKEMAVAIRAGGPNPASNSKLRELIAKAKANNVPNDNIDRAIKKFRDSDVVYEEITYEGYGPAGVAVIVETATDSRNRTAGNIRHYFDKCGGNLGVGGCVSFMFTDMGLITIEDEDGEIDEEALMEAALEAGAADFTSDEGVFEITTELSDLEAIAEAIRAAGFPVTTAEATKIPSSYVTIEDEAALANMEKMLDYFDEDEDITAVYHNWEN
ncbi:MAG: YebC/PmpR family DNA-binding transcriptional regulator [Ruminococcaceae bacterium]|nr:YebC/PmpR family DNA-binding transcriptional regulator [Oscillospiraceae bacterium]